MREFAVSLLKFRFVLFLSICQVYFSLWILAVTMNNSIFPNKSVKVANEFCNLISVSQAEMTLCFQECSCFEPFASSLSPEKKFRIGYASSNEEKANLNSTSSPKCLSDG